MLTSTGYLQVQASLAFVEIYGEGPTVLLVHTAGQSGVQWRHTVPDLVDAGYRVVVPDLPGHGRSEPHPSGPVQDLGDYAAWCLDLMQLLECDRFSVVGCSIGGKVALDLACRASGRLDAAIGMAAVADRPALSEAAQRRELEDCASPSRGDRTFLGTLASVGSATPEAQARLLATMHRREDPMVSTSDLIGWSRHDVSAALPTVSCPVHVIAGAEDYWIDIDKARSAAEAIPGGRFTVLDGVGHYPMEEIADFGAQLVSWLRGCV